MRIYRGYVDGEDIFFPVHKKLGELIKAIDRWKDNITGAEIGTKIMVESLIVPYRRYVNIRDNAELLNELFEDTGLMKFHNEKLLYEREEDIDSTEKYREQCMLEGVASSEILGKWVLK